MQTFPYRLGERRMLLPDGTPIKKRETQWFENTRWCVMHVGIGNHWQMDIAPERQIIIKL
jgi:hypothetical protein